MSLLDDFKENNPHEDRVEGDEDMQQEVWEEGFNDPSKDDNDETEAESIPHTPDVDELAKGNKEIPNEEEAEF